MKTRLKELTSDITIIKRDKREEPFMFDKLYRVCMWATDNNEIMTLSLIENSVVKLHKKISIKVLYKALKETSKNFISTINPDWDFVAAKLELLDLYRESHDIKNKKYTHLRKVIDVGVKAGKYDKDVADKWSDEEIDELNKEIKQERDYYFTWNALHNFNNKYCKNLTVNKKLELPQHTYMRVAMGLTYNLPNKLNMAKKVYLYLSEHLFTLGSPTMIGAFTKNYQPASCVLSTVGNCTRDLMNKLVTAGVYTKGGGGLGFDVTLIQAKGSLTRNGIKTSGFVKQIKNLESVISSLLQAENRRGMGIITCHWWHIDILDFLMLKDNGGTEETRARDLKYALATTEYFLSRVEDNRLVYLFDPLDAEALYWAKTDEEFESIYEELVKDKSIKKKKIYARDLYKFYLKQYFQTGNVYETRISNINPNMTNRKINSSNLCAEILIPTRPSKHISDDVEIVNGEEQLVTRAKDEEIGLCNLGAFNLKIFLPEYREKYDLEDIVYTLHKIVDNTIDIGHYPRAGGKITNMKNRYIGLGVSNHTYYMAKKGIKLTTDEALKEEYLLFQELNYLITKSNIRLAKELSKAPNYDKSLWAEGKVIYDLGNDILKNKFKHLYNKEWDNELREGIKQHGVRNILTTSLMPTASSGTSIGAIESIEPILNYSYELEGALTGTVLVPEFRELNKYYELAFDIPQERLVLLTAIRQLWIDHSQSVNIYLREDNWNYEYLISLSLLANKLGVKTSYYLNSNKQDANAICEACGS